LLPGCSVIVRYSPIVSIHALHHRNKNSKNIEKKR
jgi:hypothetical protein